MTLTDRTDPEIAVQLNEWLLLPPAEYSSITQVDMHILKKMGQYISRPLCISSLGLRSGTLNSKP